MSGLPPRLVLAGSHVAAGVLVRDPARALALYAPGAVFHAIDDRVLVLFPEPRRLRAEESPGALVIAAGDLLSTLPITPALSRAIDAPAGALVEARGGALRVHPLGVKTRIDPARWVALEALAFVDVSPLGPPPEPAIAPPAKAAEDARAALGDAIPEMAEGAREAASAIARTLAGERGGAHALPPGSGWLGALWRRLSGLFAPPMEETTALAPRSPGLADRLRGWLARLALRTRLSRFVARRQAEYLARMLELFDRGDVREGLRWAIPLADDESGAKGGVPALGVPRPRASLAITLRSPGATSTIGMPGLHELLRDRYLRILSRLQEREMVDEAAFVLAELLRDAAGAVALLERYGRFAQAARLAEARGLEPEVQVRLWVLARDVDRALVIARRHDAFAAAIALLRASHAPAAHALALEWAGLLADAGDLPSAIAALRDVPGTERLVNEWLERALEVGGTIGAKMLAMRAVRRPDRFEDSAARVLELTSDDSLERVLERAAFAAVLVEEARGPVTRALAAPVLRALVRDSVHAGLDRGTLRTLEHLADAALRADRPPLAPKRTERWFERGSPWMIGIGARDAGSIPVRDVALLPSGRTVLALGEAGVRILARDGRQLATLRVPADALVIDDVGARAIAVARRGEIHRVARVDLAGRRAQPWWEAQLTSFARTFDGTRWLVSEREVATLIDPLADDWRASWRLEGEPCVHVDRIESRQAVLMVRDAPLSRWLYDPPVARLRERRAVGLGVAIEEATLACDPDTWIFGRDASESVRHGQPRLIALERSIVLTFDGEPIAGSLAVGSGFACVATRMPPGVRLDVVWATPPGKTVLNVLLDGARECCTRIRHGVLTVGDDRGRALAIDLRAGTVLRDLRVHA